MPLAAAPLLSGTKWNGHMQEFRRDRFGLLDRFNDECGGAGRLRFFGVEILVANAPELLHEVLVDKARAFAKSPVVRSALFPLAGNGLFTSDGALWRRQRRLMAPLFTPGPVARFADAMVDCAERAAGALPDGAVVDVARTTTHVTMAIAARTLFGIDIEADARAIGEALTVALEWADDHAISVAIAIQLGVRRRLAEIAPRAPARLRRPLDGAVEALVAPVLAPTARTRALRRAIRLLDDRVARMIDERRRSGHDGHDLLSRLLAARDDEDGAMTDRQLRDEILTLFVAGHETTATGLAWSLYLLGRHPAAMTRARAEVDALGDRTLDVDALPRLGFVTRVFQEALRIYPPVYFIERVAVEPVAVGPYRLPAGTVVLVSPYALHRRRELWPDPLRFDPDRFLPAAHGARHRLAWLPFGAGPRVCIGQGFAMIEGPLVLATLLRRADLTLAAPGEIRPYASATLRPDGGVPMRVARRPGPS